MISLQLRSDAELAEVAAASRSRSLPTKQQNPLAISNHSSDITSLLYVPITDWMAVAVDAHPNTTVTSKIATLTVARHQPHRLIVESSSKETGGGLVAELEIQEVGG